MIMNSPEPMSLGSPTQSPGVGSNGQYMPNFLLGDITSSAQNMQLNSRNHNQQAASKYWMGSSSPPRNANANNPVNFNRQSSGGYSLASGYESSKLNNSNLIDRSEQNYHMSSHYGQNQQNYSPYLERTMASTTIMSGNIQEKASRELPGAPPVNRLIDILNNKSTYSSPSMNGSLITTNTSIKQEYYSTLEANKNDLSFTPTQTQHHRLSPPSPTQVDPFYTYGESIKVDEKLDETWITVFGFPQSATSYVLQEFSVYGQIIRHIPNPQGNWLHIQYQTKLQAQKALSKNGKILANSLMIGVMPCIDKRVMSLQHSASEPQFNLPVTPGSAMAKSPTNTNLKASFKNFPANPCKLDRTQSLRSNVRPLGPYNGLRDTDRTNFESADDSRLPKKNGNAISKAMEYMFGW